MCKTRSNAPTWMILVGMMFLVLGILFPSIVHPAARSGVEMREGFRGMLFGISFGINLMAAWKSRRGGACDGKNQAG